MLSLVIPVYNEEQAIADTIERAVKTLASLKDYEIVVVDDGSTDGTAKYLETIQDDHVTVLHHTVNTGYSASIKTGIRKAKGDVLAITDADGTYPIEELPQMYEKLQSKDIDMVVGARTKKGVHIPLIRRPAKAVVNLLANILVGQKIPDLNSGLRVFTRELVEEFWHLYPQRFSFTITITLAALTNGYQVLFHPIDYHKRIGSSSLSSGFNGVKNFVNFLSLIVRITTYFRPMRFFGLPSGILIIGGLGLIMYTINIESNVSDAGLLLLMTGLQIGLFGILADVTVRHRK